MSGLLLVACRRAEIGGSTWEVDLGRALGSERTVHQDNRKRGQRDSLVREESALALGGQKLQQLHSKLACL